MHELGITRSIVAIVEEHAKGAPVRRVRVAIGALSGVVADAVEFCFEICAKGTVCEGAELVVDRVPGRGRCAACGHEQALDGLLEPCGACGEWAVEVVGGKELLVKEMEV